ncbi:hypothetical protein GCM10010430_20770 [Kitasatospora cystarginea]|uniref:Uncharacterized protein n=1 Tax=Kitasatospora cystarginea TaxID=58350 RepID=A0ABP5QQ53_9ACTN
MARREPAAPGFAASRAIRSTGTDSDSPAGTQLTTRPANDGSLVTRQPDTGSRLQHSTID